MPHANPEYARRMNRVLDHIDAHLDESLDLAGLAAVANFSPFHFHRVFAAWMGETLGDYLRRRRLDVAAIRLAGQRQMPVLQVALSVGFGSGEAFARAFKARFACTPGAWRAQTPARWAEEVALARRQSNPDQVVGKDDQVAGGTAPEDGDSFIEEFSMEVKIATLPPTRVAYLRHLGPYGPSVSRFWQDKVLPWLLAQGLETRALYGIGHDDPGIAEPERCRYDACVEVAEDYVASGQAGIASLPGGRYAMAAYRGDGPGIARAWTEMLRDWLPASGMQCDARPCFEYYPEDRFYDPATGEFSCFICVPVRPL